MAITIAKLSTISTLDSTQFSKGLTKMRTDIGAFSAVSFGAFSRIGGMIADFSRRAVTALPRMVLSSIQAGDALADLATQLGFSTMALANLQRVSGLAGIDIGSLEGMIGKMNATLGEALNGNSAAAKSFSQIGLNIREIAAAKPEEVFYSILDALSKIPGTAQRSAAAMAVFGRSGRGVLRLTDMGSKGLRDEMGNTRRLGIVSSKGDLAALSKAGDTLDNLRNNFKGISDQLAKQLAPAITGAGEAFLEASKKMGLAVAIGDSVSQFATNRALTYTEWGEQLGNPVRAIGKMLGFNVKSPSFGAADKLFDRISGAMGSINSEDEGPGMPTKPLTFSQIAQQKEIAFFNRDKFAHDTGWGQLESAKDGWGSLKPGKDGWRFLKASPRTPGWNPSGRGEIIQTDRVKGKVKSAWDLARETSPSGSGSGLGTSRSAELKELERIRQILERQSAEPVSPNRGPGVRP